MIHVSQCQTEFGAHSGFAAIQSGMLIGEGDFRAESRGSGISSAFALGDFAQCRRS
jgi:hypothetical protein